MCMKTPSQFLNFQVSFISLLKLRTSFRFRYNLGCQYLLNVCSAQDFSHLLAHKEMMGVDDLRHFSDDSSCGKDNGFVLSWSPIKVDLGGASVGGEQL